MFIVNSPLDRSDASPGDGMCRTSQGVCTLRAAIIEANALAGADTIQLPAGVFEIEIPTLNTDAPETGDFDIFGPLTLYGFGTSQTIIDGGFPLPGSPPTQPGIDRLFEIHPGAGDVTFQNLTLREGFSVDDGGAIQNWSSGLLLVKDAALLKNMAQGSGGAINNGDPADYTWATAPVSFPPPGQVEIVNTTLSGNAAASGAAVNNVSSGSVTILNSQVVDNPGQMIPDPLDPTSLIPAPGVYTPGGGAIANEARIDDVGTLRVSGSSVARNYSTSDGAGIYNGGSGVLVVENATVSDNTAEGGGAGIFINGGTVSITGSTIEGNEAHDGGGIYSDGALDGVGLRSRVTISGSTIRRNKAEASGGGLANGGDAFLNLTDVTFDANHAGDAGGGLENGGRASMTLTRVRFTGNEANGEGGGAWTGAERLTVIADSYFLANKAGVPTPEDLANPGGANTAGGGGLYTENGPVTITGSGFANNSATEEGGGISIDNFGDVTLRNSVVRFNRAGADGGGIENSGTKVTFDRLTVSNNRSELDGGGIYNSSSGEFTIVDTTIELNSGLSGGGLANAPDGDLIMRRSLIYRNTARNPGFVEGLPAEEGGIGGGIFSLADGDALIENSTISGNTAARSGGGLFHDADGLVRIVNSTFWRNAAPVGGAIGVMESDFVPTLPPSPVLAVVLRNTIVGGSTSGGSCDYYISTEGGNLDTTTSCFLSPTPDSDSGLGGRDRHSASFSVDAIADNGGATLTHALRAGTIAVDGGANPCVETDARGVTRPQNSRCDIGAYEYVGAPAPPDSIAPDTQYLSGPVQNSLETVAFTFSGSDAGTGAADLQFECRLLETNLAEAPELLPPWMPVPPELMWLPCSSPWTVPLVEEGLFNFEVRAIDRADNIDPTPAVHTFNGADTSPPNTSFIETPPLVSNSRTATFTFAGSDNLTPPQFLEFECRLDSRDPDMWVECLNPTFFSNLTSGEHILEVRALDGSELIDPTPARYTWTVGQLPNCDAANITLTATADAWVDEVNPLTNFLFYNQLEVRSGATGDPTAVPPVPVVGENARALVRFALPTDAPTCVLEAATLRLYNDSPTEGRLLQARPLGASWLESTVNWSNQPATLGSASAVTSPSRSGPGYQEWDVTAHVQAMREGGLNHGWQIRDAVESDLTGGGDQSYASRELPQDPPEITLPQLVLRYKADATPAPPPPAPTTTPTTVVCGQVLTQSTLLANDLTNCPGEGLVVGASNIVVDLNGHTIDGPNYLLENVSGQEEGFPAGIRVSGKTNVIVRNGTVQEFGYGVQLTSGTTRVVVDDITALRNAAAGVELFDADNGRTGNTVQNSTINDNELGVALVAGSENSIVRNNTIGGNLGEQIFIQYSSGHLLENNTIHGIPSDPLLDSDGGVLLDGASQNVFSGGSIRDTGDAGIVISAGSNHNMVQGVAMYRNGDAGVIINDSEHNQVIDVVSHQQSDGGVVLNNAHDTVVRDSDLRYNPSGVEAGGSNNIVITNNDGSDSLQAGFEVGNGLNIQIIGNTAHRTGGSGISLESSTFDASGNPIGGALIAGNYTDENRGDGISVSDGGHTIRNNTAYNNAGFGIRAGEALAPGEVPGPGINIDGSGNIASGNAEPEQCIGVVCGGGATPPVSSADTEAPITLILSAPISPTGSLDATFVFSATDNTTPLTGMVFECRIDPPPDPTPEPEPVDPEPPDPGAPPEVPEPIEGEGWAACVSPITYSGLEPGLHHFEVRALDQAEPPNKDLTPAAHDWVIDPRIEEEETGSDTVAPETRISAAPDSPTTATSATFRFAGSDNSTPGLQLTFECSLNGAAYASCLTPLTYASLGAGNHTFSVRARDRSGNLDPSPATHSWTVIVPPQDTTAPETTIATGPDGVTVSTTATFTFSSNELGARFECSLNGGTSWATCTSPATFTSLAVGNRELRVRAIDEANNVDASPAIYAWTISAAPVLTTVSCGQVITRSILLRNNLSNCQLNGIVVGASGITIDLNAKLVDGTGQGAAIRNDGHDNVTIKNGRVEDFDYGVMLNVGTVGNYVEKITARNNQEAGIALGHVPPPAPNQPTPQPPPPSFQSGVSGNIVRNNTLTANDVGVWLINAARANLITNNVISATPSEGFWVERAHENQIVSNVVNATSGAGIGLIGSRSNIIRNNTLTENGGGIRLGITDSSSGSLPSDNNVVQGNIINESNGDGIEVNESAGNQLLDNSATFANGEGVSLYNARANLVRGNDLRNNKGGISLIGSSDNRLEGNDTSDSDSDGISLQSLSVNNDLIRNISSNNSSDGIYIGDETSGEQGMLLDGNITNNNVGYGIYISKVSHVIKNNIANDNDSWGIWASEGSNGRVNIDGGGNRAQGNLGPLDPFTLKPLQCYSVQCDGGPIVSADEIPPDTLLIETPPTTSNAYGATFRFTGSDNASSVSFECQVDGGAWSACTSPASYVLPVGMRNFKVRAVDIAGNIDQSPASYVWTITTPPSGAPETTINSGPDAVTVSTSASFTFSASEAGSTFQCALDGGAFVACASPASYTGLSVGAHGFQVRATDQGNETDTSPASFSWTIGAAPAPATVGCGQILVQSTRVLNNLIDCGGHGLIVGANGITIDLNGHFIDGIGLEAGILNNGFDNVTISNGAISNFDYGVLLNPGTAGNVVTGLRLELNQEAGIALSDADQAGKGNTVRENTIVSNAHGVALFSNTSNAIVRDNAIGANSGDGVRLEFASNNQILANEIANSSGDGIVIEGGAGNTIIGNTLSANMGAGIAVGAELLAANNSRVESNTISGGASGISVVDSTGVQVLYNTIRGTSGAAISLDLARTAVVRGNDTSSNQSGIALSESSNNRIEANNASDTLGTGIEIGSLSFSNQVLDNAASLNAGEGIHITDQALAGQGNLVEGNTTDSNGGDGIAVDGVGHTLAGNTARTNGGWGIYVAVSASDGGGNFAAGNVEAAQCLNIVCTLGTVAGTPETWIIAGPVDVDTGAAGIQSNSRNASFTYNGSDNTTAPIDMVFECRIDSTNDLAWQDCEYPAEALNLSAGPHVFEVRAVDIGLLADPTPARYEWTYVPLPAGVAPVVTLDIVPEAASFTLDALFTFFANEPDVTFECKVDLFGYEPCGFEGAAFMSRGAYEWGLQETEVGLHTFYVRAIDFEGNVGAPTTYTWRLLGVVTLFTAGPGFTPPETPEDPPTGGPVRETTATIEFTSNVADATFECSLDLAPFAPCTSPVTYNGLLEGGHELRVVATDTSTGVTEAEAAVYEWEVVEFVDTAPPDTTIERAPASNSSDTTFEFTGTDGVTPPALLTFECRVDSTSELDWQACVSPFNLLDRFTYQDTQLAPGQHTFEVRAIDNAEPVDPNAPQEGNIDPTPASYTWTMIADTVPPGTGIFTTMPATIGTGAAVDVEFFGTDNATPVQDITFECAVDLGPFVVCTSPESLQGLEPGAHTFYVRAVDLAGNVDTTPATRSFTVVPAPITTILTGPAGRILPGASAPPLASTTEIANFTFSANQAGVTFECSLDGAPFVVCTSPRGYTISASGTHSFEVQATNAQGVVEEPPAVYEWLVELGPDVTPPNTSITAWPSNPSTSTVATFGFTGSDTRTPIENLVFECAIDGNAYSSCTSPQQFSDLVRGSHTVLIRARDLAGNFDPTPASYTWVVELPPVTSILTGPAEYVESTSATFTFAADVPGSTFQCWLDGTITPCTSPVTYNTLPAGDHLFAVLATAPNGTLELAWAEWEWRITDITPPIVAITSGPGVTTQDTSASFVFSANELGVTYTCALDGRPAEPCSSPAVYPRLHPGAHSFAVTAFSPPMLDANGVPVPPLYEPTPTVYEWTIIDLVAPETAIMYGPAATTAATTAYFGFTSDDPLATIECSLDGAAFSSCETPYELSDLAVGSHTLVARAVDLAGNVDATPEIYPWTIVAATNNTAVGDNVSVTLPIPGSTGTATITFAAVTAAGATTIDALTGGPPLPGGYSVSGGRYYDISTTALYGQPVTLCLTFDPLSLGGVPARLLHFDGSLWIDITTLSDPSGRVCGEPESFSPFALAVGSGLAPIASIASGPPNPSDSGTATFTFFADQPEAVIQCSLDGLPFENCTSPITYTQLEAGGHDFQIQAIGVDGQAQLIPSIYEWEVVLTPDTTPPDTVITVAAPPLTANFINTFEFSGSDDQTITLELSYECALNGGIYESCSTPEEIVVLAAGVYTLTVRAIDDAGNVDPTPASHTWQVVDFLAPDTTIDLGPDSETTETSAVFEFSGEEANGDPVSAFECALDTAEFAACTTPYTVTNLDLGAHVLLVRAISAAGTVDPSPDFYEWLIIGPPDTTPPDTFIVSGPPAGNSGPDVTFGFASDEPVDTFECALDGGPWESCDAAHELLGLAPGQHTLLVRAIDAAEIPNVDPTPAEYTWTTLGEPDTIILSGPPAVTSSLSATFTFTTTQEGATFQCSLDGSLFVACTSPFVAGPLLEDTHQFEVRAVNQFVTIEGEQVADQTPASYTWEVQDATPPDTTVVSVVFLGPNDLVEPNSWRFQFAGEDNRTAAFELSFECALDGGLWSGCDPIYYLPLEGLAGGAHVLAVRAVDEIGNFDPTPATHTFTVEGEPQTTILSGPAAETDSTSATFTFSSDQTGASFECSLDLAPFTACVSGETFTNIPYGEHELLVRAVSPLGTQTELTPAEYIWTSGYLVAPDVTIISGPAATTLDTTATFTFTSTDTAALFQCSLDGATPVFCTSGVSYTNLLGGEHSFEVVATKNNLLVEPLPAEWIWTVGDQIVPTTTIVIAPPQLVALGTPASFTFASNEPDAGFECALDGGLFEPCAGPPPTNTAAFSEPAGEHTLLVRAVDPSGNADPTPESFTWTVVAPPDTQISGPATPVLSTTATFEFVDQPGSTYSCAVDSPDSVSGFTACTSPYTTTNLADGAHIFQVRATNLLGELETPAASFNFTVVAPDTVAPTVSLELTPPATTVSTAATFIITGTDNRTLAEQLSFECSLDGAAFGGCEAAIELTGLGVGPHTFEARAVDLAGITGDAVSFNWTVTAPGDSNTPAGTGVSVPVMLPGSTTATATITFTGVTAAGYTAIEASGGTPILPAGYLQVGATFYDISTSAVYNNPVVVCISYTPGSLAEPVRLLHFENGVWADVTTTSDPDAGLVCGEPESLSPFAVASGTAAVVPETTIVSGPPASTISTFADFTFSSDDPLATFQCSLDAPSSWGSCPASSTFASLTPGEHTLRVRAVNALGNFDASTPSYTWTVLPLPETTIVSGPADPTESTSATFTFSSDDPLATFECALDDAPGFLPCESGITYNDLALGEHELRVRAKDVAGNVDPTPDSYDWSIGNIPGVVTISSGPDALTESTTASFVFSADEQNPTFECSLDGALFAPCASPMTYSGVPVGPHTFQVRVLDPNAVAEAPVTTSSWTVAVAPTVTILTGPGASSPDSSAEFTFVADQAEATFECALDLEAYAACTSPHLVAGLTDGAHELKVRARSAAGLFSAPAVYGWMVIAGTP